MEAIRVFVFFCCVLGLSFSIYVPNEIDNQRPYTTGIKIKTAHYKTHSQPYYHTSYSKVSVQNKNNYTSSLLDASDSSNTSHVYPVYISEDKVEKIKKVLKEHNSNIVDKDTLNNRVVFKRRIDQSVNIQAFNQCPPGVPGQFVYDLACNQYLDCWNGRGGPRNCAPGTLFNPKTSECDYPQKVECLTGSPSSRSARLQSHEQAKCPEGFSGLIPNYTDCSKFVQCNNGIFTPRDCPPGTLFDTNLNVCNHEKDSTCFAGAQANSEEYQQHQQQNEGHRTSKWQNYDIPPCNPQSQDCRKQYVQYVTCNPSVENCTDFTQGMYMMGPNGALCNPANQQCGTRLTKSTGQSDDLPGQYFVVYVMCADCGQYKNGFVQMGIPGTLYGAHPVGEPQNAFTGVAIPCDNEDCLTLQGGKQCNPLYQDCSAAVGNDIAHQGQPCNPAYQDCGSNSLKSANHHGYYPTAPSYVQGQIPVPNQGQPCDPSSQNCQVLGQGSKGVQPNIAVFNLVGQPCDPSKQNCGVLAVPNHGQSGQACDPYRQNCGANSHVQTQIPVPYGTYGHNGQPCDSSRQNCGATSGQVQRPCNPQYQNCGGSIPPLTSQRQCNPQYENCYPSDVHYNQDNSLITDAGYQEPTNYKKVCNDGDVACYGSSTTANEKPQCPDNFQGIIQHPTECKKFLNCANGITYIQDCAPGTLFNPALSICDFPQNVKCAPSASGGGHEKYGQSQGYQIQQSNYGGKGGISHSTTRPYQQWSTTTYRNPYHTQTGAAVTPNPTPKQPQPINKTDRKTFQGFSNQNSIDYVDIFNPSESQHLGYATQRPASAQKTWPPPFPVLNTDLNADYVFEYEDGEEVTLAPENQHVEKKRKTRCDENDFLCDRMSCIEKNFVCDAVKDCTDGRDERYCQKYLDEFKIYKDSRLDVLEKQRWDNVSFATCALLCMDNRKFECKSFNYRKLDKACFLTNENIGSTGSLISYVPCDYYERKSTSMDCSDMHKCPSGKCLNSEQICDGYDDCGDRADEKGCRPQDFGYKVKLAGSEKPHEGRVEVTVFGKTGYICDDQFKLADAEVLCKELGFELGALEVRGNSYFAKDLEENHTLYMMDDIHCFGNETSLMQCEFAGWGIHNCADREIAGVICKTPQESCGEGYWKCDRGNECVRLPYLCDGYNDCSDDSDEMDHHCNAPTEVRLVNGTGPHEGRLEVRHFNEWGSVCDDDFNDDAAKIVCGSLGYAGAVVVKKEAYFGSSSGPIWLDQVSCAGNESALEQCTHWDWGEHNCDHTEDVGIVCSNNVVSVVPKRNSKSQPFSSTQKTNKSSSTSPSPAPTSCGYTKDNIFLEMDDVHFRVVQGSVARPGDYPWQAAIKTHGGAGKSTHWCGAVVVASKWVLTAAHCLEGYQKGVFVVVAGEYDNDENEGTEQQAFIEEYYLHENFRKGHKMGNDIAMIRLKGEGFALNQDIQPICLPDEDTNYERDLNCTISGFGTVQSGKSAYSQKLRAAWIPVLKMDVCKMAHIYGDNIKEGMICAGDLNGGVDACDGDSGGPLACLDNGVFTLYGLTSWGQRCGYANKPGVYVKVGYYKKWIENIMKTHE